MFRFAFNTAFFDEDDWYFSIQIKLFRIGLIRSRSFLSLLR